MIRWSHTSRARSTRSSRRTRVVQPDVGNGAALLVGGLRGDPGAGVFLGHAAVLDQPSHPHFDVGVHDDHQREQRRHTGFHQQRDVLDDDGIVVHGGDELSAPLAHQRVNDPVELLARLVVAKALAANAGRSSAPSGSRMSSPNASTSAASPSVPGSTTSREMTSPSTMIPPHSENVADTADLPAPMPPVSPMRSIYVNASNEN